MDPRRSGRSTLCFHSGARCPAAFVPFFARWVCPEAACRQGVRWACRPLLFVCVECPTLLLPEIRCAPIDLIAAIFFVLVVWLLFELLPSCRRSMGILAVLCVAALSARAISLARSERRIIMTAVGIVECRANIAGLASTVVSSVTAGDTMFVYPYLPIIYFITGTKPTTPYLFLQPGMMEKIAGILRLWVLAQMANGILSFRLM